MAKSKNPALLNMRYPVEDGQLFQQKLNLRKKRLAEMLNIPFEEAMEIARQEFAQLMATRADLVSSKDPAKSKEILERNGCENIEFINESIQFFQNCDMALVKEIPMKTIQKTRYSSGIGSYTNN